MHTSFTENPYRGASYYFFWLSLLIVSIKTLLLILDPKPAFHFGDSGAYLATALSKWIPPDRSFTYGFLLRPLDLESHSLMPVLLLQTAMSAIASIVTGLLLIRYLGVSYKLATLMAALCAIEPLQLMSERFVMTEAAATFAFAFFVWCCLAFLESGSLAVLVSVQVIGVILVSLRFSFLPLILVLSILLPILSVQIRFKSSFKPLLIRLALAITISQALLLGYRHLYGALAQTKAAYLSRDGDFLLADMVPLIQPIDFPITAKRRQLFQYITIPLTSIDERRFHRWVPGGICEAVLRVCHSDEDLANRVAKTTALRAMWRDPLGVVRLAAGTYREFLDYGKMEWALKLDQGHYVSPTPNDVAMIKRWFDIDARDRGFNSLTKRWEGIAVPWCWLMVTLPMLYGLEIGIHKSRPFRYDLALLSMALVILLTANIPVEIANPRYLTPLPWLSILILGVIFSRFPIRNRRR